MKRIVRAGVLAGLAAFVFSAGIHVALPIGHMGFDQAGGWFAGGLVIAAIYRAN